jgi:hypothetical protein
MVRAFFRGNTQKDLYTKIEITNVSHERIRQKNI